MRIRSLTVGVNWDDGPSDGLSARIQALLRQAKEEFAAVHAEFRTTRLTLPPLNTQPRFTAASAGSSMRWLGDLCDASGLRWACVPWTFLEGSDFAAVRQVMLDVARRHGHIFLNAIVADSSRVSRAGVRESALLIQQLSRQSSNGFDNFRLGVSCNCAPHTPFFPFSRHEGPMGFSIALETATTVLRVMAASGPGQLEPLRESVHAELVRDLRTADSVGQRLEAATGMRYYGIDASLAPFPDGDASVARIVEDLTGEVFGHHGCVFATSFLTNLLKGALAASGVRAVGFNGVMYSVLEDDWLAKRARQRAVGLDALKLYSALCGCGLDMVPIPGDVLVEDIQALIWDIAAMAICLKKPLGVRVLPIPGGAANDVTQFNHDFLVNTRVMVLPPGGGHVGRGDADAFTYL